MYGWRHKQSDDELTIDDAFGLMVWLMIFGSAWGVAPERRARLEAMWNALPPEHELHNKLAAYVQGYGSPHFYSHLDIVHRGNVPRPEWQAPIADAVRYNTRFGY
jgi:hypothetical protein